MTDFNRKYKSQSTLKSYLIFPCVTKKLEKSEVVLAVFVCVCVFYYFHPSCRWFDALFICMFLLYLNIIFTQNWNPLPLQLK